jgi:hypothetical protein
MQIKCDFYMLVTIVIRDAYSPLVSWYQDISWCHDGDDDLRSLLRQTTEDIKGISCLLAGFAGFIGASCKWLSQGLKFAHLKLQ